MTTTTFDPVKRSPCHQKHAALGARFVREAGWELPADYGSIEEERSAVKDQAAVVDITPRGKIELRGDIGSALSILGNGTSTDAGGVTSVGGADGGFHLARVSSEWGLCLCAPDASELFLGQAEAATAGGDAMATDVTSLYAGFALLGPAAVVVLSSLMPLNPDDLAEGGVAATRVAEIPAIVVSTAAGMWPFELYVGSEYARYAWEAILDAGRGIAIRPAGWKALRAEGWW